MAKLLWRECNFWFLSQVAKPNYVLSLHANQAMLSYLHAFLKQVKKAKTEWAGRFGKVRRHSGLEATNEPEMNGDQFVEAIAGDHGT